MKDYYSSAAAMFDGGWRSTDKEEWIAEYCSPDDADGCLDLDAEKKRLSTIWELAHLSMRELVDRTGLSQTAFAKRAGIPLRTVQGWCLGERDCPAYVRFLLAEHYKLL